VLYDVMGEVAVVELLAREYPDVAFVIPHLGSFADDWRAQSALIDHLVRHPNVYTDTSGVRRFDILQEAVERAGAPKVLFGSDGPWLHPGLELAKVRLLSLAAADEQLILSGNAERLLSEAGARRAPRVPGFDRGSSHRREPNLLGSGHLVRSRCHLSCKERGPSRRSSKRTSRDRLCASMPWWPARCHLPECHRLAISATANGRTGSRVPPLPQCWSQTCTPTKTLLAEPSWQPQLDQL